MSLHLWWMHWLGDALERHGPVYMRSSYDEKPNHEDKSPPCKVQTQDFYQGRVLRKVTKTFPLHLRFPGADNCPPSLWNKRDVEHPEPLRADCLTKVEKRVLERGDRSADRREIPPIYGWLARWNDSSVKTPKTLNYRGYFIWLGQEDRSGVKGNEK